MKKIIFILTLALSISANANDKEVIATVDGKNITRGQLESELAQLAEMVEGGAPTLETFPKDFQAEFINKYIDKVLIVDAAKKAGVNKSPEIKEKLQEAENYLSQQKYLTGLVMKQKNDKALKEIYDEKIGQQEEQLEVHASHILVEYESKAKELKKKLDDGADFDELAMENSIEPGAKVGAGDLGYFIKEEMVPEFSEAVFKLKAGDISEPVKTDFGWHIIKLHDKRKKKQISFKEAKPALETEFARRVIANKVEELRKTAKIDIKLDLEPEKKAAVKAETKAEEKPEVKAEKEAEAKPQAKAKAEIKNAKPKIKAKVEAKTEKLNEAEAASGKE